MFVEENLRRTVVFGYFELGFEEEYVIYFCG